MSKDLNITEMIAELNRISSLYDDRCEIELEKDFMQIDKNKDVDACNREAKERLCRFQEQQIDKITVKHPQISSECSFDIPVRPYTPYLMTSNPLIDILIGIGSGCLVIFSVVWCLAVIISNPTDINIGSFMLSNLMLISSTIFWFAKGRSIVEDFVDWYDDDKKRKKYLEEWEKKFDKGASEEEYELFISDCKAYDASFFSFMEICSKERDKEIKKRNEAIQAVNKKYEETEKELDSKMAKINEQLEKVTLIDSELFGIALRISTMLKQGRADTLKEAINKAFDEARKDEEEEERQDEARRQEAILMEQAEENRKYNEAMQRLAEDEARATRAHNQEMEKAAQAQAREAARQTELAKQQARDASRAAIARCSRCANYSKCSPRARENAVACSAYTPR